MLRYSLPLRYTENKQIYSVFMCVLCVQYSKRNCSKNSFQEPLYFILFYHANYFFTQITLILLFAVADDFTDIFHSLDIWHKAKSIRKCIQKVISEVFYRYL